MFNSNNDGFTMPVVPMNGNGGDGFFGGNGIWAILLIALLFGGWGGFGGFGGGYGMNQGGIIYPWMNQAEVTQNGFRDQMLNTSINTIGNNVVSGFGDVQTALCGGFAGVNATVNGAQNAISQQMYTNQIADLNRSFDAQTAMTAGMNTIGMSLQNCCCENRANVADLKYTVATENCADRAALSDGIRDLLANQTANTQRILDQLCNDKIDAKNEKIADLQNQLNMASLRESQVAQNAFIAQGFSDEVDQLYNRLSNCPVPSTPVYGRTPIFTCNQNTGCGCGCNNGF